jgi:hypothetical protein
VDGVVVVDESVDGVVVVDESVDGVVVVELESVVLVGAGGDVVLGADVSDDEGAGAGAEDCGVDGAGAAGAAGAAGGVAAGAAAASPASPESLDGAGGAATGAAGAAGSTVGVPIESEIVGTFAYGSVAADDAPDVGGAMLCSSLTTGTVTRRAPCAADAPETGCGAVTPCGVCAARAGAAGSGASGWSFGTLITGVPMVGSASVGSAGFDVYACTDCRNAVATGVT